MSTNFTIPDSAPRRGNPLAKSIATQIMRLLGWRLLGEFPAESKFVAVAAPHRSAWDFFLGILVLYSMGVKFSWMAKHSLFWWPQGSIMRWLGGIAINRTAAHGVVAQVASQFAAQEKLIIAITPEGSRKRANVPVQEWKRGFYHIAHRAQVPIVPIHIDYPTKQIYFGQILRTSGNVAADLSVLQCFYDDRRQQLERTRDSDG